MRTILGIRLPSPDHPDGRFSIDLPKGSKVISAGELMAVNMMFVEAEQAPAEPRSFALVESTRGGPDVVVPDEYAHVSTWQSVGGVYVFHLYERPV